MNHTVAPDSTSYPTLAACEAFGLPMEFGYSLGWAVILQARGEEPGVWERRAISAAYVQLGAERYEALLTRLIQAYRASGVIPS